MLGIITTIFVFLFKMIQVIKRALNILEYVSKKKETPASLTEIANEVQLNLATCANIVKTLADANYLDHVGRKKGYRLGAMAYQLSGNLSYNENLLLASKDEMERLSKKLNESCILGIIRNNKRFLVHTVNSDQNLQVRSRTERNVYETASGRVLLAFLPDKEKESLIDAIGLPGPQVWKDVKNRKQLDAALAKIRDEKLAFTLSPEHIVGIAVPLSKKGIVVARISVFFPESRLTPQHKNKIVSSLRESAKFINELLDQEP